jgi:hypothetical protein
VLLFLSPVVYNQNENQSDSEHSASNLNNRGSGHGNSSFFQQNSGCAPRFEQTRATPGAIMAKYPVRKTAGWPAKHTFSRCRHQNFLRYLTRVRRRWINTNNTIIASTAALI